MPPDAPLNSSEILIDHMSKLAAFETLNSQASQK